MRKTLHAEFAPVPFGVIRDYHARMTKKEAWWVRKGPGELAIRDWKREVQEDEMRCRQRLNLAANEPELALMRETLRREKKELPDGPERLRVEDELLAVEDRLDVMEVGEEMEMLRCARSGKRGEEQKQIAARLTFLEEYQRMREKAAIGL